MKGLLSIFDLVSFILPGLFFIGILELITENDLLLSLDKITILPLLIYAGVAYIVGQAMDTCSQFFIEKLIINIWIGHPAYYQLRNRRRLLKRSWGGKLLLIFSQEYCSPLTEKIRGKLIRRAREDNIYSQSMGRTVLRKNDIKRSKRFRIMRVKSKAIDSFNTAYHLALREFKKNLSLLQVREFFIKYNFARNTSFVSFVCFLLLLLGAVINPFGEFKPLSVEKCFLLSSSLAFISITLFFRSLKFYGLYAYEILTEYAATGSRSAGFHPSSSSRWR